MKEVLLVCVFTWLSITGSFAVSQAQSSNSRELKDRVEKIEKQQASAEHTREEITAMRREFSDIKAKLALISSSIEWLVRCIVVPGGLYIGKEFYFVMRRRKTEKIEGAKP